MKFKKGDRVRIKKFKERPRGWNECGEMDHLMGKVVEIKDISRLCGNPLVYDSKNNKTWMIHPNECEPVNECIVIYRKDNEVIAHNKVTDEKAVAKCSPDDTFDFETGAKLAFDRLVNTVREVRRKAKVGEYVRVLTEDGHMARAGSIIQVEKVWSDGWVRVICKSGDRNYETLRFSQYVVLENYVPEQKSESNEIKVGDHVKVINTGHLFTTNVDGVTSMTNDPSILARYAYDDNKGYSKGIKELPDTYRVIAINDYKRQALIERIGLFECEVLLIDKKGLKKC